MNCTETHVASYFVQALVLEMALELELVLVLELELVLELVLVLVFDQYASAIELFQKNPNTIQTAIVSMRPNP